MTILITGGAGFIGANFVLDWLRERDEAIVNLDKLTYAGNLESLSSVLHDTRHQFIHGDITNRKLVGQVLAKHQPRGILHFAAESHVDRSIRGPGEFIQTNVLGTFNLLEEVRSYFEGLSESQRRDFRMINISTDEVYGSLGSDDPAFTESHPYAPNSPYSASKAAADHLCRSYVHTYGLPIMTSNCSNNYGPLQFPEKLIPLMIGQIIEGKALPVYGDGKNVRDWLFVGDHCRALGKILEHGVPGETYNIGGNSEMTNIDLIETLCELLAELVPGGSADKNKRLITFVEDRPGHDRRYAVDARKIQRDLGWTPAETFASGLRKTVQWYLDNEKWIANVKSGDYRDWMDTNYTQRVETS